jgi:hypothetical protein
MMKFLHIPKTAGTSILRTIGAKSEGHNIVSQLTGDFFSCVRNPYDRACSMYWFMLERWMKIKKMQPFDMSAGPASLLYFWQTIDHRQHPINKALYAPQIEYLRDNPGEGGISPRIKHLFRYETLQQDWPAFASEHSFAELPHLNKSERPSTWQDELTEESIAIIGELYADDFEHLNYERIG